MRYGIQNILHANEEHWDVESKILGVGVVRHVAGDDVEDEEWRRQTSKRQRDGDQQHSRVLVVVCRGRVVVPQRVFALVFGLFLWFFQKTFVPSVIYRFRLDRCRRLTKLVAFPQSFDDQDIHCNNGNHREQSVQTENNPGQRATLARDPNANLFFHCVFRVNVNNIQTQRNRYNKSNNFEGPLWGSPIVWLEWWQKCQILVNCDKASHQGTGQSSRLKQIGPNFAMSLSHCITQNNYPIVDPCTNNYDVWQRQGRQRSVTGKLPVSLFQENKQRKYVSNQSQQCNKWKVESVDFQTNTINHLSCRFRVQRTRFVDICLQRVCLMCRVESHRVRSGFTTSKYFLVQNTSMQSSQNFEYKCVQNLSCPLSRQEHWRKWQPHAFCVNVSPCTYEYLWEISPFYLSPWMHVWWFNPHHQVAETLIDACIATVTSVWDETPSTTRHRSCWKRVATTCEWACVFPPELINYLQKS